MRIRFEAQNHIYTDNFPAMWILVMEVQRRPFTPTSVRGQRVP